MIFDHARIDALPAANSEPCGSNATVNEPISADGTTEPGIRHEVPARHGRAVYVPAGKTLRIINTPGTQVCDM